MENYTCDFCCAVLTGYVHCVGVGHSGSHGTVGRLNVIALISQIPNWC